MPSRCHQLPVATAPPPRPEAGGDDETRTSAVTLTTIDGDEAAHRDDVVAREEPLEIRVGPASLAVVMRTPGDDEDLALGFLVTERIVAGPGDVQSLRHCADAAGAAETAATTATAATIDDIAETATDNVIRAVLGDHVHVDLARLRRNLYASSSCGICGKATIEQALASAPPLHDDDTSFAASTIRRFPAALAGGQAAFRATGGLHAAALFDASGSLLVVREDIGRHNAVDKVVGWAARGGRFPLRAHALMVSGRASYEIVQKALAARIPMVAAVSAPSSLAIALARASGIALVGFLRGDRMNVYAGAGRIAP